MDNEKVVIAGVEYKNKSEALIQIIKNNPGITYRRIIGITDFSYSTTLSHIQKWDRHICCERFKFYYKERVEERYKLDESVLNAASLFDRITRDHVQKRTKKKGYTKSTINTR